MRGRDLLPVLLLVGLAGFVGGQVRQGWKADGRAPVDGDVTWPGRSGGGVDSVPTPSPALATPPDRRADVRTLLASEAAARTYAAAMLKPDSLLPRWPHAAAGRAVRVWVQPASVVRGWHPSLVADARTAFETWAREVPLRFAFTNDSATADVRVRWTPRLEREGQVGGNHLDYTADGHIVRAEMTLAVHDGRGEPLPPYVRALTALHEVGHALGLGHSPNAADVMAARHTAAARATLTAADVATARLLYAAR